MIQRKTLTTAALLAAGLTLTGCQKSWVASGDDSPTPVVEPDDFVGEPQTSDAGTADDSTLISTNETDATPEDGDEPAANPRTDRALPVDAMVGHINGEAVFADQVFDINLIAQLESFGRRYDGDEFRREAAAVIIERLDGIIQNRLVLGEAERNLSEAQRLGVERRVQAEREELLRFYGQGAPAKAKAEFLADRGKELEEHLADFEEELVIVGYARSMILPRVVVNQRDIERYYADNIDQYQQQDQRVIRLIRATDQESADKIESALGKGQAFEKLAANPDLNQYNPDNAGIFNSGKPIAKEKVISIDPVNDALIPLKSGEHAGPITAPQGIFFVQIVELTPGVKKQLRDVQNRIEMTLRAEQIKIHEGRFYRDLFKRGSYSDPREMGKKLLEIAQARYDQ